jgi:hypothetical protein
VAVRRAHHGNLDALIAQSSDTSGPFSFDHGPPFEIEAELAKESDRRFEVIDDDSYVVHSFKRHVSNLQGGHYSDNGPWVSVQKPCQRGALTSAQAGFGAAVASGGLPSSPHATLISAAAGFVGAHRIPRMDSRNNARLTGDDVVLERFGKSYTREGIKRLITKSLGFTLDENQESSSRVRVAMREFSLCHVLWLGRMRMTWKSPVHQA